MLLAEMFVRKPNCKCDLGQSSEQTCSILQGKY